MKIAIDFMNNFLFGFQFQKMNFSPFTTQFTGLPANSSLAQFTTAKFAQNLTTSNGQVSQWNAMHGNEEKFNQQVIHVFVLKQLAFA